VVFEGGTVRRRKASIEPSNGTGKASRPGNGRRSTACIVHTLLEKHDKVKLEDHSASYEGLAQERLVDKDPHSQADQTQNSRLLTKKQISDMAFGIRELSKKLSQIRLKLHVKTIFILGKAHDATLVKYSREVVDWLLTKNPEYTVCVVFEVLYVL
jgi:NAD+ kinase